MHGEAIVSKKHEFLRVRQSPKEEVLVELCIDKTEPSGDSQEESFGGPKRERRDYKTGESEVFVEYCGGRGAEKS